MANVILIPAYNPDEKLINLIYELFYLQMPIVVVNDGSEKNLDYIFTAISKEFQVKIINHEKNKGKGAAIKTGIEYIKNNYSNYDGIITADADGQHLAQDIYKVSVSMSKNKNSLILGTRNFSTNNIPLKSKFGNRITSLIFYLLTFKKCCDTQTGLRGIPRALIDKALAIPGERYEYEMNMLIEFARENIEFVSENITTIYINNNKTSHFKPIKDSIKIYLSILKFSLSSLMSSILDIGLFTILMHFLDINIAYKILIATIFARITSGTINFLVNKIWVFSDNNNVIREGKKYIILFLGIMMCSYLGVSILSFLAIPIILIKMIVDGSLFVISYKIQNKFIFNNEGVLKK